MTVHEAIAKAEKLLPGKPAPKGKLDPRWLAIIEIEEFVESDPEAIWPFVLKWGSHRHRDTRDAICTLLIEHLLEYHFDLIFPRVRAAALSNRYFADTTIGCSKFGQAAEPARAKRFERLCASIKRLRVAKNTAFTR